MIEKPVPSLAPGGADTTKSAEDQLIVESSGALVMLGDRYYDEVEVRSDSEGLMVVVPSSTAEDEAALRALRSPYGFSGDTVAYAHLNEGGDLHVVSVDSVSSKGRLLWTIRLREEQQARKFIPGGMGGGLQTEGRYYTPHDFAVIKANRILLDRDLVDERNAPGFGRASLPIEGFLSDSEGLLQERPLKDLRTGAYGDTEHRLRCARLRCVYLLRRLNVVDTILELRLGLVDGSGVPVRFRGRRPRLHGHGSDEDVVIEGVHALAAR